MAKLVFGMNQSLDGYVDHLEMRPSPALFRHFIEQVRSLTGSVYGRRLYEVICLMDWFGADPGGTRKGKPCFGVAWLRKNGSFETSATDCAHSALRWI